MIAKFCVFTLFIFLLNLNSGHAQPVASSKQLLGDLEVYRDFKNENLFYYAPGDLALFIEPDDKPKFQLLEMRYTGTLATGDNGEKRFMNVVQFTVSMDPIATGEIKAVKEKLKVNAIDLRPLPIRDMEAFLVAPLVNAQGGAYKKIGKDGSFQAEGKSGTTNKSGFWTERTFTLKLENHEAQLLWDQVANGQLSLSLGYAFYADMIPAKRGDMNITGDSTLVSEFETENESILTTDTVAVMQLIKADAFPIRIDVKRWPDLLRKIDINEGVPPAYAALEVRCYDFADDLRPDLALKGIDITATGVGGQPVSIPTQKFLRSEPDLYAKQIHFPYAVKLTQPYRYRIVEYTADGSKSTGEWKTINSWTSHLDITTPAKENAFLKKELDIEVPLGDFADKGVDKVDVLLKYKLAGRTYSTIVSYKQEDELPLKQASFKCDKTEPVTYEALWTFADATTKLSRKKNIVDDYYLYLTIPER